MDPVVVANFLTDLAGAAAKQIEFEKIENEKRSIVESLRNEFTPAIKDKLRQDMTFRVVDSKGKQHEKSFAKTQEKAVDTYGSVKKGRGIAPEDQPRVQKAMEVIVGHTKTAIDRLTELKRPEDKDKPVEEQRPVYDLTKKEDRKAFETFVEIEVFTPLVREGLLPETLVNDAYSEVQKLLNATFENYQGTLKETLEEERDSEAKELSDLHVKGGTFHAAKKKVFQAKQFAGYLKEKSEPSEETKSKMKIAVAVGKAAYKSKKAVKAVSNMIPEEPGKMPKGVMKQDRFLNPEKYKNDPTYGLNEARLGELGTNTDPDALRMELEQQRKENRLVKSLKKLGPALGPLGLSDQKLEDLAKDLSKIRELQDTDPAFYGKSALDLLKDSIGGTVGIIKSSIKIDELGETKAKQLQEQLAIAAFQEKAAEAAVEAIDTVEAAVTAGVIKAVNADAGDAFDGLLSDQVDEGDIEDAAGEADADKVIKLFADGIKATFETASPSVLEPLLGEFTTSGKKAAEAFDTAARKVLSSDAIKEDPAKAFDQLGQAAFDAVAGSLDDLEATLKDPQMLQAMAAKSLRDSEVEDLEALEKSEEEIKEFERTLVLIDEAGVSLAEQQSIEVLIANLKRDKEILKLVNTIGETLTSLGGTSTNIAAWATTELTDVVAGQVCSALKAAKLIMKLAIDVKKSVDRWRLFYKFKTDLERSKKAVSSLSTTIQGFFNNKAEQCTFAEMQNALTCVQIAAAVMGSVPEPFTMAIGKAMNSVASAAEASLKATKMIYNEKKLAEGWAVTKEALDNPRDRATGLKALRLNPTLGMHALAWAALEKTPPDPIARMMFDSLGVTEQTIASGASEKQLREYLTELLDEDRQLTKATDINVDWAPASYDLTVKSFFVVVSRAQRDASPKLRPGDEREVLEALKVVEKHKIDSLTTVARVGELDDSQTDRLEQEAETLCVALNEYAPVATDGSTHIEMSNIADTYVKFAAQHRDKIKEISLLNASAKNPSRAFNTLNRQLDILEIWFGKKGAGPVTAGEEDKDAVRKDSEFALQQLQEIRVVKAFADNQILQDKTDELAALIQHANAWLEGDQPKPVTRRRRSGSGPPPKMKSGVSQEPSEGKL
jgi:hypothetical protein